MKKLSKQVLALGLASGVLLSGLPLGNVVDASSKTVGKVGVTKVAKAELTTKQKVLESEHVLYSLRKAHENEFGVILREQLATYKAIGSLSAYRFKDTFGKDAELAKRHAELNTYLARLDAVYEKEWFNSGNGYDKLTDAKKLVELDKRIRAVNVLNASGELTKLKGKSKVLSKNVLDFKAVLSSKAERERVWFEAQKLPLTVLLEKNEAWMKNIPLAVVVAKFEADLVAAGKSNVSAKVAAKELTDTLVAKGLREKRVIDYAKSVYVDSFKRSVRDIGTANHTVSDLRKLNDEYLDLQQEMSMTVSLAYKKHGLKPVIGAFLLK